MKVTQDGRVNRPDVFRVPSDGEPGLSLSPYRINQGGNSGYQAIGLAYHLGIKRIALVGFDMQYTGGKSHWHGDHPQGLNNPVQIDNWVHNFDRLAVDCATQGLDITNCSEQTALKCFKRGTISEWIEQI